MKDLSVQQRLLPLTPVEADPTTQISKKKKGSPLPPVKQVQLELFRRLEAQLEGLPPSAQKAKIAQAAKAAKHKVQTGTTTGFPIGFMPGPLAGPPHSQDVFMSYFNLLPTTDKILELRPNPSQKRTDMLLLLVERCEALAKAMEENRSGWQKWRGTPPPNPYQAAVQEAKLARQEAKQNRIVIDSTVNNSTSA